MALAAGHSAWRGPVGKKSGIYRWGLYMCIYLWILFGMYVPVMYVVSSNFPIADFFFFCIFFPYVKKKSPFLM